MFDIGFSELLLIAVVALVVLGPERLPKAARFAGLWVRRARAQWDSVKQELERELEAEELKRSLQDVQASLRQAETQLRDSGQQLQRETEALRREIDPTAPQPPDQTTPAEPAPVAQTPDPLSTTGAPHGDAPIAPAQALPPTTSHPHLPDPQPPASHAAAPAATPPAPGATPSGGDAEAPR
ncbi:Sec-independent protein translocase protein TatB [Xanthomonas medicagonis]|uniref:Sec-independent protein translocase protein TatB n=1 Tax=Xanthomonas medicagonis TaxID=3160841 RepID=UPI00351285A4